jgi:FixJ family two-component response regulator/anti-sigma regulatory factor (Ser/Thr protein kinase)
MQDKPLTIIVVDDEEVIRFSLQKKLSRLGYNVISLEKAEDALYILKSGDEQIDLIISDIKLRKMDGIELLRRVKAQDEPVPVLLITGHGNVEDAVTALRFGADDFIRKPFDINDLASSVRSILRRKHEKKLAESFAQFLEFEKLVYRIPNDVALVNTISYKLTRDLIPSGLCNRTTAENISLALKEAVSNAMFHGNLEISSSIREKDGIKGFNEEIEKRKDDPKYRDRMVRISCEQTRDYVEYIIEDEGQGFNYRDLPDPRAPDNFFKSSGRGLLIIRVHMDEVKWNDRGNCVYLKKYRIERNGE